MKDQIRITGNKEANYVEIDKIDDDRIRIKIGDCCVVTLDFIVTAEVLSNFLTNFSYNENGKIILAMKDLLAFNDKEYIEEIISKCEENKLI